MRAGKKKMRRGKGNMNRILAVCALFGALFILSESIKFKVPVFLSALVCRDSDSRVKQKEKKGGSSENKHG